MVLYLFRLILVSLLCCTGVIAGTISRHVSSNSHLSPQELPYVEGDPKVTHRIVFEISERHNNKDVVIGELILAMFGELVPKTVMNFVHLSNMTYGFGYKDNEFHRVIQNFMIQAGEFVNGETRKSIYNDFGSFDDENFELLHDRYGRVSMANAGPNTNGGGFFITNREDCSWLNGKHVVFGQLIGGMSTLQRISEVETKDNRPVKRIFISNAAVFNVLPEPKTSAEASTFPYTSFFIILLLVGLVLLYKKSNYRKQRIFESKDENYF